MPRPPNTARRHSRQWSRGPTGRSRRCRHTQHVVQPSRVRWSATRRGASSAPQLCTRQTPTVHNTEAARQLTRCSTRSSAVGTTTHNPTQQAHVSIAQPSGAGGRDATEGATVGCATLRLHQATYRESAGQQGRHERQLQSPRHSSRGEGGSRGVASFQSVRVCAVCGR